MRIAVLVLALAFTAFLGVFTIKDLIVNGATLPGLAGAVVVFVLAVGLTGALLHPPDRGGR